MIPSAHFITGTDTDVGKTITTAALALALHQPNQSSCGVMKPIQTGCEKDDTGKDIAPDLLFCQEMLGQKYAPDHCVYTFSPACSPHLAAGQAKQPIDLQTIVEQAKELMQHYDYLLLEGAGGVLVPINEKQTMLDLMCLLNLPIILTARTGLGTINHTLLSIRTLQVAGLTVAGIVYVDTQPATWTEIEADNLKIISAISGIPGLGHIPYFPELNNPERARPFLRMHGQTILSKLNAHD